MHPHRFFKCLLQSVLTSLWKIRPPQFCVKSFAFLILCIFSTIRGIITCSSWNSLQSWLPRFSPVLFLPLEGLLLFSLSLCCLHSLLLPLEYWNSLGFSPRMSSLSCALACHFNIYDFHIFLSSSPLILGSRFNPQPPWITPLTFLLLLKLNVSEKKKMFCSPLPNLLSSSQWMISPPISACWNNLWSFLPTHLSHTDKQKCYGLPLGMSLICTYLSISNSNFHIFFFFCKNIANPQIEFFPSASFFSNLSSTIWSMSLPFYCQGSGARFIVFSCSVSGFGQPHAGGWDNTPRCPLQIAPPFPCLRRWGERGAFCPHWSG